VLASLSQRLIQFKRIAVLTDLGSDSEKTLRYAACLARWYGAELLLAHACHSAEPLRTWPGSGPLPKRDAEEKCKFLAKKLALQDLSPKTIVGEAGIESLLGRLEGYRPSLLVLATHGREGIRKWLEGSVAEKVFRRVQWPVLIVSPGFWQTQATPQKQFERILFATDLSAVSLTALQYAAGISHDHEAQLMALYVETDPTQSFSFDQAMAQQRLRDWLQDRIDGLAQTLAGVRCIVDFGKPENKIVEVAVQQQADIVVLGARGVGALSGAAGHFLGGTAYEVACSSKCPVLIVPQPR